MTKSRFRRRLSLSLEKMLASYSLAGAATLGSVCAPPGECAVVYTSIHAVRSTTSRTPVSLPLDLNHDGSVDFQITASRFHFYSSFNAGQIGYLKVIPMGGNQIVNSAGNHYADAFNVGAEISPALNFVSPFSDYALLGIFFSADGYGSIVDGHFPNTRNKFVALKLSQNGQDFMGGPESTSGKLGRASHLSLWITLTRTRRMSRFWPERAFRDRKYRRSTPCRPRPVH